jgi:hypothetical protein
LDIPGRGAPPLNEILSKMLGDLESKVPSHLPPYRARLLSMRERPVGLANWRGVEVFGSPVPVTLKGGRLDAGVLFEVSGDQADDAEAAALALHSSLLGARDVLRSAGFLRIDSLDFSLPEENETTHVWRKTVSYRVLYEYQYRDVDDTASFITRIPLHADPEEEGSPDRETSVITGRVVRWQREEAPMGIPPPPTLVVRGPGVVRRLTVLSLLPDLPGPTVEVLRTFEGASGPPLVAALLQDLAGATHIHKTYASLAAFLDEFVPAVPTDTVELADLNGDPAAYGIRTFTFTPELSLPRPIDRLEISTSAGAWGVSDAVLYLRAEGA